MSQPLAIPRDDRRLSGRQDPHFPDDFEAIAQIRQGLNVTGAEQRFCGGLGLAAPVHTVRLIVMAELGRAVPVADVDAVGVL